MREIEHGADEATHEIIRKVNSSFITPFDREDIHGLASALDDCMDLMEATVDLIVLYRIGDLPAGVVRPGRGAVADVRADRRGDAAAALDEGPRRVLDRDQPAGEPGRPGLPPAARGAVQRRVRHDAITIMKLKEVVEELEAAADAFETGRPQGREHRGQGVLSPLMDWLPIAIVIALAMVFNYTNGFHDAANAIATSVSTRALTPRVALVMAAVANLVGGVLRHRQVAATVGKGIIAAPHGQRRAW